MRKPIAMNIIVIPAAWAAVAVAAFGCLLRYSFSEGPVGAVPRSWPSPAVAIDPAPATLHRLVIFLHPRCPCSRATVRVLERIVARCGGALEVQAVLVRPYGTADGWEQTDLSETIAAIPGVRTTIDRGGELASRFGARTSGQVVLYDRAGKLVFSGGITPSRGHEGDSAGADALLAAVDGRLASGLPSISTPVYGCTLGDMPAPLGSGVLSKGGK